MKVFRSLRWQIQSWHTILLVLIVGGMLTSFYYYERQVKIQLLDAELWSPVHAILPLFAIGNGETMRESNPSSFHPGGQRRGPKRIGGGPPPLPPRGPRHGPGGGPPEGGFPFFDDEEVLEFDAFLENERRPRNIDTHRLESIEQRGYYICAWVQREEIYKSEMGPTEVPLPTAIVGVGPENSSVQSRWNGGNRELIQPTPNGSVLIGVSSDRIDADLAVFRNKLVLLGVAIVLVGYTGGWWIAKSALKPVELMSKAATQISEGDLSQRIDESRTENELSDLAHVLNESFEKLESSINQQVRFTADASHEMRTPLAVILAKSELALSRERSPEKYRDTIQACHDSATHMHALIESLLELSKVDSGQFDVFLEKGDLSQLVEESVALIQPLAEQKDISITCDISDATTRFDVQRLKQVLINILSNAIKYNHAGGRVEVRLAGAGDIAEIRVKDTGPGINEAELPHVFDRFYKADDSRKSEKGSTGLGLAISKAIVVAHHGDIRVSSIVGEGTTFVIEIPASLSYAPRLIIL